MRRVLIVDDHAGFRAAARALLEADGFAVIGEADAGGSAVDAALALQPDAVLLDVQLPDVNGFDVCERIKAVAPAAGVVLTSGRGGSAYRTRLAASSALGFIPKDAFVPGAFAGVLGDE